MRAKFVSLHRWIGLALGAVLLLQSLTGAAMVFRNELNHALHRAALTVVPAGATVSVQTLADQVRALHPTLHIVRIEFPRNADEAFWFRLEDAQGDAVRYVSVDPYRALITRDAPLIGWPAHWLFELHEELLLGPAGLNIVGVLAVGLLLLAAIGLYLWWPGLKGFRRSFKVKLSSGAFRGARDLHRVAGVCVAIVLMTTAITGILVIWRAPFQSIVAPWSPITIRPAPKVAPEPGATLLPVDTMVAAARQLYGDAQIKSVRIPGGHGRVIAVYLQASGTTRARATDQVWFNGYTGAKLASYEAASVSPATTFFDWALPIHTGQAFGLAGRLIFMLAALTLSGLVFTGFLQWILRYRVQRPR